MNTFYLRLSLILVLLVCVFGAQSPAINTRLVDPLSGDATATPTETPTPIPTPPWIQYTEKVVGEGHASYADVVNRPAKYIWSIFRQEHDPLGAHTPQPTPLPTSTPQETPTPQPTATPQPTPTPQPTATPQPTPTPIASEALAPIGSVMAYAGTTAPSGWLLCQGQAVSRTDYATLFGIIGTKYGTGDGSTTFNLPDLLGRAVIGAGSGSGLTTRTVADKIGEETHTLTIAEIPAHGGHTTDSYAASGGGGYTGSANKGGGGAHNNMQPSLVLSYIIRVH